MSAEMPPTDNRPVVLLVDDERSFLEPLRMQLETGCDIETAVSAEEAEIMMASRKYDVVVCDHLMPGELGLNFLIRMRMLFPHTRRIMLTGYMNPELISRSISLAGLSACLNKPIKAEAIAAAIRESLQASAST